jgi:hypothetical protein
LQQEEQLHFGRLASMGILIDRDLKEWRRELLGSIELE